MKLPRLLVPLGLLAVTASAAEWRPLFNGRDLTGWETWLGVPAETADVPGLARGADGKYAAPVGADRDPLAVFTIVEVDGAPAVRISGQINGALTTRDSHGDYRLRVVYQWGEKKWNPAPTARRNSGLLYHGTGEHGAGARSFLVSFELQMMEGNAGDFIPIGPLAGTVRARATGEKQFTYDPAAAPLDFSTESPHGRRVIKAEAAEKPAGGWNTLELVCQGDRAAHYVNGRLVAVAARLRRATGEPLTAGRIQIQSEGAELFVRSVEIQPLTAPAPELAAAP